MISIKNTLITLFLIINVQTLCYQRTFHNFGISCISFLCATISGSITYKSCSYLLNNKTRVEQSGRVLRYRYRKFIQLFDMYNWIDAFSNGPGQAQQPRRKAKMDELSNEIEGTINFTRKYKNNKSIALAGTVATLGCASLFAYSLCRK